MAVPRDRCATPAALGPDLAAQRRFRGKRLMGDREIDQQLVERAQHGEKHAFELLVSKYQRKLGRLL